MMKKMKIKKIFMILIKFMNHKLNNHKLNNKNNTNINNIINRILNIYT
jgi:hypothetical protein